MTTPLQTELDGKISLQVLARVLGVSAPSKRHAKTAPMLGTLRKQQPAGKMKQIRGGIFFPKSSDDASASDALCDSSDASGPMGAGADKERSSHGMIMQPLHHHELADVAKVCANRASLVDSVSQITRMDQGCT